MAIASYLIGTAIFFRNHEAIVDERMKTITIQTIITEVHEYSCLLSILQNLLTYISLHKLCHKKERFFIATRGDHIHAHL